MENANWKSHHVVISLVVFINQIGDRLMSRVQSAGEDAKACQRRCRRTWCGRVCRDF